MINKKTIAFFASLVGATALSSCDGMFIFIDPNETTAPSIIIGSDEEIGDVEEVYDTEWVKDTNNTLFFALYNYYGQDGQHFTNRWLGMLDALNEYGIEVTGYEYEKDARNFKIDYTNSKLPADAEIYMVNNQTWDTSLQFTRPLTKK